MQKLREFDVLFATVQNKILDDLGIDGDEEFYSDKGCFDLNEVESFTSCSEDWHGSQLTRVRFKSGDLMTVLISYSEFKNLFKC